MTFDALPQGLALWNGWCEYADRAPITRLTAVVSGSAFRPRQLMPSPGGIPFEYLIIHDLRIGDVSYWPHGEIPADQVIWEDLELPVVKVGQSIQLDVEYVGQGENMPFRGMFVGLGSDLQGVHAQRALPMIGDLWELFSGHYRTVIIKLDGMRYVVEVGCKHPHGRRVKTLTWMAWLADPNGMVAPGNAHVLREHAFAEPRMVSLARVDDDKVWQGHDEKLGVVVFTVDARNGRVLCNPDGLNEAEPS